MLFKWYTTVLIICVCLTNVSEAGKIREKRTPQSQWWNHSFPSYEPMNQQSLYWNTETKTWNAKNVDYRQTNVDNYGSQPYYQYQPQSSTYEWNQSQHGAPPPPNRQLGHLEYNSGSQHTSNIPYQDESWETVHSAPNSSPPDKRSPQGPHFMSRGPAPPPQHGRNSFDNRGPPNGNGPPFQRQPPGPRSPPGQDPYWIPPGHRNRPGNGNQQNRYNFQESVPKITSNVNPNTVSSAEKIDLERDSDKSTTKLAATESSSTASPEKDSIKITYDAGRAVAVVNGNSNTGAKVIPVTLIFQAQPVTPAS